jgi:hypothetical protein
VNRARGLQLERYKEAGFFSNAQMVSPRVPFRFKVLRPPPSPVSISFYIHFCASVRSSQ